MKNFKKLMIFLMSAIFMFVVFSTQLGYVFADGGDGKSLTHNKNMAFELGYFKPSLTFNARYTNNDILTEDINFKDELGLVDKHMMEYRLWINKNLRIAYANVRYLGNSDLTTEISYGDTTFDNTNVISNLGIDYYRLTWLRPLGETKNFTTNWLVDVKGFKFDTKIHGENTLGNVVTEQKDFSGAIPALGLRLESKPPASTGFACYGEISGLPLGKYGYAYDLELGAKYHASSNFALSFAYRLFDLSIKDGKENGNRAKLKQSGPYFNIACRF